jgi:hypothetical protein
MDLLQRFDIESVLALGTTSSFSCYPFLASGIDDSVRTVYVDNILSSSVIHTFGVNNSIIAELYFDPQLEMVDEFRNYLVDDFASKRVCTCLFGFFFLLVFVFMFFQ